MLFQKNAVVQSKKNKSTELLVTQAVIQLNAISESQTILFKEMHRIAQTLPEYPVVHNFYGVGDVLASQIIAEVGDIRRFTKKSSLVCFAGVESPPPTSQELLTEKAEKCLKRALLILEKHCFRLWTA